MTENGKLSTKQQTFVLALLSARNLRDAARLASIGERTAYRWMELEAVKTAYVAAQQDVFNAGLLTLKLAIDKAVKTLERHLEAEETPPGAQIRAAQIIIEQSIELHKLAELEAKIADLEARLEAKRV
jgi:hypothetical protein